jgi:hypothetical protein
MKYPGYKKIAAEPIEFSGFYPLKTVFLIQKPV